MFLSPSKRLHTTRLLNYLSWSYSSSERLSVFNKCCTYGNTKHCHLHIDCFLLMDAPVSTVWCININNRCFRFVTLSHFYKYIRANGRLPCRQDVTWISINYGNMMADMSTIYLLLLAGIIPVLYVPTILFPMCQLKFLVQCISWWIKFNVKKQITIVSVSSVI